MASNLLHFIPDMLYAFAGFGISLAWSLILFNIGVLLEKNLEVFNYFNIRINDTINHLVDSSSNIGFNPSKILSSIGMLLKLYAIGSIIYESFKLLRFIF